jgi:exodeoxyribonuclease VII small subunit
MTQKLTDLPTLELSLSEISTLIDKMEHSDLTLEQSLEHFERGIVLIKHCQKILTEAEQKVQILMQNQGEEQLTPYATGIDGKPNEINNDV